MEQEKLVSARAGVFGSSRSLVDVYREYIGSGPYADSTRYQCEASLRLHIEPYFRHRTIGSLKPKDLRGWLAWMVEECGYARSTVVDRYGILRGVLGYAVANGYLVRDPSRGWSTSRHYSRRGRRKMVRLPTLAEVVAIAEHLPAPCQLLVWLMAGCGLRAADWGGERSLPAADRLRVRHAVRGPADHAGRCRADGRAARTSGSRWPGPGTSYPAP